MTLRKIMTSYAQKPAGFEPWNWAASFEDSGDDIVGWGETQREAIDDLIARTGASQPFQLVKPGAYS